MNSRAGGTGTCNRKAHNLKFKRQRTRRFMNNPGWGRVHSLSVKSSANSKLEARNRLLQATDVWGRSACRRGFSPVFIGARQGAHGRLTGNHHSGPGDCRF